MAINQTGIAIVIKAFLPTGKTLDEAFNALSIVKSAHETGDYTALLAAAQIDEIKTEQKTRRIEVDPKGQPENHGVTVADLVNKADPMTIEPQRAPFVPTECDDAPVGLAVVEDNRPLPWADGVTDDTVAVQAAIDLGIGLIEEPEGGWQAEAQSEEKPKRSSKKDAAQ